MIRQTLQLPSTPTAVFTALMTSEGHSSFTGAPAVVEPTEGAAWSAYGGGISGRTIELIPGQRIVQAWRAGNWPQGTYSVVHIELAAHDGGTQLVLTHTGYPEDQKPHLEGGWHERYWSPLTAWLANR